MSQTRRKTQNKNRKTAGENNNHELVLENKRKENQLWPPNIVVEFEWLADKQEKKKNRMIHKV